MTFLDKLDYLMEINKLNKRQLSQKCSVGYTTIDAFYKQGYENMKLSNLRKIADYFGVTMDYLVRDEITQVEYYNPNKKDIHITKEEELLITQYRISDSLDKELARRALNVGEKGDEEKMA